MKTIGQRLRAARIKKNLTIPRVSERTKISRGNLSLIENDKNKPSSDTLVLLSELYDVSTDWILKGRDRDPSLVKEAPDSYSLERKKGELEKFYQLLVQAWEEGDEEIRGWILVQLRRAFPEIAEKIHGHPKGFLLK